MCQLRPWQFVECSGFRRADFPGVMKFARGRRGTINFVLPGKWVLLGFDSRDPFSP